MGKARMLGMFKPCSSKSRLYGSGRRSPWQGAKKKSKAPEKHRALLLCDELATRPPQKEREE